MTPAARRPRVLTPFRRPPGLAVVVFTAVVVGASGCSSPTTTENLPRPPVTGVAAAPLPAPAGEAFYAPPDPLPPGKPGDLLWAATLPAPPQAGTRAWRMLYRSRSLSGADIAVSGVVVAPSRRAPRGGWPVVSWGHGTTGSADSCAPSRDEATPAPLARLAAPGYVVAATDYEGLGTPGPHPYLVGDSAGRSVLDAARAARKLAGGGRRVAVAGHSQGGHAALFAGELAASYAPELRLVGVAAAAPATELDSVVARARALPPAGLAAQTAGGFVVATLNGLKAAYPEEVRLEEALTPKALGQLGVLENGCILRVLGLFSGPLDAVVRTEVLERQPWAALATRISPGERRTPAPVLVLHGDRDSLLPLELSESFTRRACAQGTRVDLRPVPGATHGGIILAAEGQLRRWLADRFAARRAKSTCP